MSTYSPNLRIELISTGTQAGIWGGTTNDNLSTVLEAAVTGYVTVTVTSANQALTYVNGPTSTAGANESVRAALNLTTSTTADFAVYAPPVSKTYIVKNSSIYTATIYNSTVIGNTTAAGVGVAIPAGKTMAVWSDGTDFKQQTDYFSSPTLASATLTSATLSSPTMTGIPTSTTAAAGTNTTQVATTAFTTTAITNERSAVATLTNKTINLASNTLVATSAQLAAAVTDETGSGALVFATSPTLVTPVLGTPTSGTLTNCTGLPVSTGVSGFGTGVATALATNTGSAGAFVVNGGALGTPSSGTLTNATGLPVSTGISGLGTGVATFLATPSSANLAAAVTDETGSGALVFGTSPTISSPSLTGTPTAPTASAGTNTTQVATTAFVAASYAPLASPALTGTPTAPTASAGTNTTQIATTAFVQANTTTTIQAAFPVGSIYMNASNSTNPATLLGFGTWVALGAGRVLLGAGTGGGGTYAAGATGGSKDAIVVSHTHTITDPGHVHGLSGYTYTSAAPGGGTPLGSPNYTANYYNSSSAVTGISVNSAGSSGTDANLPPYLVVYMWQRTA